MATRLKPVAHEDRLSVVEHLDELRSRIIICLLTLTIVGGICLWQDDAILNTINRPLTETAFKSPCDTTKDPLEQSNCWQQAQRKLNEQIAASASALARRRGRSPRRSSRSRRRSWRTRRRRRRRPRRAGTRSARSPWASASRSPRR
jgi:sec-independent protein translocase protein TatC